MRRSLPRRTLLRGVLGGCALAVGLPRLEAMLNGNGTAYAAGEALPKRFGIWAWSNGVHLPLWVPEQTGTTWQFSDQLSPLSAHREYLSVVSGMETKYGIGKGHCTCHTNLLTGMPIQADGDFNSGTASGPSIDQIIAASLGEGAALRSFELGVDNGVAHETGTGHRYFSHNAPDSPNVPLHNTRAVFDRLFPLKPTPAMEIGPSTSDLTTALRQKVVDALHADAASLSKKLGANDRMRLAQHMDGINAIEQRLQRIGASSCVFPEAPAGLENVTMDSSGSGDAGGTYANLELLGPQINLAMAELLATALACDITRVFTYQYSGPGTRALYPSLGIANGGGSNLNGYHAYTHADGDQLECKRMVKYYMSELAVLLDVFKRTPDGAGNLLDSCAILGTTDVAEGLTHSPSDFPMLVLGKAGGNLRGGVHYRSTTAEAATKVPLTLARAVGVDLPSFGVETQLVQDSVAELLT